MANRSLSKRMWVGGLTKHLSSIVVYRNCQAGLGPCSNQCGGTVFPPFCARHTCFHSGPFLLPGPDRVDPGRSLKLGPAPQHFRIRLDFGIGPSLISAGTTITHCHDVDTMDWANNTWLNDYLPDPLHVHWLPRKPTQWARINMC